jgi:DNA-binding MarR family transcriptional regulator
VAEVSRAEDLRRIELSLVRIQRIGTGREAARRRAERAGVNVGRPAIAILGALHHHGPVRLSALSGHTGLEAPLVSREVSGLVAANLVTREADPADGRAVIVALTEAGHAAYCSYRQATDDIIAETFSRWSVADLGQLASYLERVAHDFAGGSG